MKGKPVAKQKAIPAWKDFRNWKNHGHKASAQRR